MRFARLDNTPDAPGTTPQNLIHRLLLTAYNVIWWIPMVLALFKIIDYHTAFIAFLVITVIRAGVNLYRTNILTPEQARDFPFRSP